MKKQFFLLILTLFIPLFSFGCMGAAKLSPQNQNLVTETPLFAKTINATDVSKNTSNAVVGIQAKILGATSIGTGVSIAPGYIVSNEHVVSENKKVDIHLKDGSKKTGTVIWTDKALDLSIIQSDADIPYLGMLDKDSILVGEEVIAIGTPLDLQFQHTITKGIVSALNRTVAIDTSLGESYLQDLIQHDASINPGNSGGPLINSDGKIIGINTLKVDSAEGLGFAIPTNAAQNVITHIISDGNYVTPYIGVFGVDRLISKYYGRDFSHDGIIINSIDPEGPATNCGLKTGDIITKINGENILNMLDLRSLIYKYKVGETISIEYIRGEVPSTCNITLVKHPIYG